MCKKVLIGLTEIAANIFSMKKAFENEGYIVNTVVKHKAKFYKNLNYTYEFDKYNFLRNIPIIRGLLNRLIPTVFFLLNFSKYDYFIYIWRDTYLPLRFDHLILKILHKKFCIIFCGDDIRYRTIALKCEEKKFNIKRFNEEGRKKYLRNSGSLDFTRKLFLTAYTNFLTKNIFSSRSQSTLTLKPFYKLYMPLYPNLDGKIEKYKMMTIVHAPTDPIVKNSKFILGVIDELRKEGYEFNAILLKNRANEEVLKVLARSHILIDQIDSLPGILSQEGMYFGCAVMGGNKQFYEKKTDKIPVIDIILDKEDLKNKIISLLKNPDKIKKLGEKGRKYIQKYHSGALTVKMIVNALEDRCPPDQIPLWDSKKELLSYCKGWYQRILVKIFIHP